jgi:cysteine synthase A
VCPLEDPSVGTGGTLAEVGMALKAYNPNVVIALADPLGAAFYHYYKFGELKAEGDSITEGIGQGRI